MKITLKDGSVREYEGGRRVLDIRSEEHTSELQSP